MKFGSSPDTNKKLIEHNVTPGFVSWWIGPWMQTNDDTRVPTFDTTTLSEKLQEAKANNWTPVIQSFYYGDEICLEALKGEVNPTDYNGRVQSLGGFWELNKIVARLARDIDVNVILVLEPEWSKRGPNAPGTSSVLHEPAVWDELFSNVTNSVKGISNGRVAVCTSPGSWVNMKTTLSKFPKMMEATDYVGTQMLRNMARESLAYYLRGPDHLLWQMQEIHDIAPTKKKLITDLAFSTYMGGRTYHPFEGGNGRDGELYQWMAFSRLNTLKKAFIRLNVEGVLTRSITDSNMDVKNYFGYGERYWGVMTNSGERKMAFDQFIKFAQPIEDLKAQLNHVVNLYNNLLAEHKLYKRTTEKAFIQIHDISEEQLL